MSWLRGKEEVRFSTRDQACGGNNGAGAVFVGWSTEMLSGRSPTCGIPELPSGEAAWGRRWMTVATARGRKGVDVGPLKPQGPMRLPRRCAVGEEQVARGKSLGSTVDQQRMARKKGGGADHSDVMEAHDKPKTSIS